jgi:hypothetical protein
MQMVERRYQHQQQQQIRKQFEQEQKHQLRQPAFSATSRRRMAA